MSLDRIEVNGVPLVAAALDSYNQAVPARPLRRCDTCGVMTSATVSVGPGLPMPGRYCRSCIVVARDATLGIRVAA